MIDLQPALKILFLPRWYPHRYDPMPGLFVQRQAEALAIRHQVVVLYVHPDPEGINPFEIDYATEKDVHVIRVYFRVRCSAVPLIAFFRKRLGFFRAYFRGLEMIADFEPDLIHSHILTRAGIIGHWLSKQYRVPHIISEHWSRYFKENLTYTGFIRRWITRYIVKRASALIAVSEKLKEAMQQQHLTHPFFFVVPNIVDLNQFFSPVEKEQPVRIKILHVSCFEDKSKNISGLLRVMRLLSEKRSDFSCYLVGDGPDFQSLKEYAKNLGLLNTVVFFEGIKEGHELVQAYQDSSFVVVSSRYETFGMVIAESLACGIPVVSTPVGIAGEIVTQANGILTPSFLDEALAASVNQMLDHYQLFDRQVIRNSISHHFSPETVSRQIEEIYHLSLKR